MLGTFPLALGKPPDTVRKITGMCPFFQEFHGEENRVWVTIPILQRSKLRLKEETVMPKESSE